jgi:hypothetical protein
MNSPSARAVLVQSELFREQMAALERDQQEVIWSSLSRAREGKFTPGVENPWGGDYLLWPCGPNKEHRVVLRPLNPDEIADVADAGVDSFYLISIEPSPI